MKTRLVIVGPTAGGKSSLGTLIGSAVSEAGHTPEFICADSMTVYRGLDIGTAKPTDRDRSLTTHHCLDLVDPCDDFSVSEFQASAQQALHRIATRGHVPIVVGGTGLYVESIVSGLTIPPSYPEIRAQLEATLEETHDTTQFYVRLQQLDPLAASRMDQHNGRRILRALEVCIGSGRPFSSFGPGMVEGSLAGDSRFTIVGLEWDRELLTARIKQRLDEQFESGFWDEAVSIRDQWGSLLSRTVRQALGYREIWTHLDSGGTSLTKDLLTEITVRTRQFAVRQQRWFRRDPRIHWLNGSDTADSLVEQTLGHWRARETKHI